MNFMLDTIVTQSHCGASFSNTRVTYLVFADNTVILAESLEDLAMAGQKGELFGALSLLSRAKV